MTEDDIVATAIIATLNRTDNFFQLVSPSDDVDEDGRKPIHHISPSDAADNYARKVAFERNRPGQLDRSGWHYPLPFEHDNDYVWGLD